MSQWGPWQLCRALQVEVVEGWSGRPHTSGFREVQVRQLRRLPEPCKAGGVTRHKLRALEAAVPASTEATALTLQNAQALVRGASLHLSRSCSLIAAC